MREGRAIAPKRDQERDLAITCTYEGSFISIPSFQGAKRVRKSIPALNLRFSTIFKGRGPQRNANFKKGHVPSLFSRSEFSDFRYNFEIRRCSPHTRTFIPERLTTHGLLIHCSFANQIRSSTQHSRDKRATQFKIYHLINITKGVHLSFRTEGGRSDN